MRTMITCEILEGPVDEDEVDEDEDEDARDEDWEVEEELEETP
jgi:hypothetical protein